MITETTQLLSYYTDVYASHYLVLTQTEQGCEKRYVSGPLTWRKCFTLVKYIANLCGETTLFYEKANLKKVTISPKNIKFTKELELFLMEQAWIEMFAGLHKFPQCIAEKTYDSSLKTPNLLEGL